MAEPANHSSISLPLDGHTGATLRNLLNLMYSRADLISKATGGAFSVDKELLAILDAAEPTPSPQELRGMVERYEAKCNGIRGFTIVEDQIIFTGFGEPQDAGHTRAYTKLAARLNQMALKQKRILAKKGNIENEKYAMHIFLIRLGMSGPDFREARKILMERLSGSQAFRTPDQEERAKVKNAKRREELKVQRTAAQQNIANC